MLDFTCSSIRNTSYACNIGYSVLRSLYGDSVKSAYLLLLDQRSVLFFWQFSFEKSTLKRTNRQINV
jgi:hypothetical protein